MTDNDKTTHGGARPGAGRPPLDRPGRARTMRLVATDEEWAAFNALLPSDARERFGRLYFLAFTHSKEDGDGMV